VAVRSPAPCCCGAIEYPPRTGARRSDRYRAYLPPAAGIVKKLNDLWFGGYV